ncbi:heme-dependent oxidative N-demethylase family protein [Peribacillus sp. TH14]|uniref:heme-dependent oxidative N-demethylase family protein n=1 Tax=Peribacillus sp. TH14 TaxID=2798481 RepID=UPI001911DDDB|nr:DUF3445 domain-containing protein [Peribacillus sp. TH14]MBK5501388.1 DUF3445 domain-containing protein [Peribacillus sp. TH14]
MKSTNLEQFPFPFTSDSYRYSNDLKPLESDVCAEITPEYKEHIERKRKFLREQPERRFQSLPQSIDAQWEWLEFFIEQTVEAYPDQFSLKKEGAKWTFTNHILNEEETFVLGETESLPCEPLDFIGRHFHNDFLLVQQRDGDLFLEAGQIAYAALFSVHWNLGMSFLEIHNPVPLVNKNGVNIVERIRDFLLRVEAGKPWMRINWNLMADNFDVYLENIDVWGPDRYKVTNENAGKLVHLRVEEQKFYRLPRSNAIMFVLNTQFLPLEDLAKKPEWLNMTYNVLSDIPEFMAEYKGIAPFLSQSVEYLKNLVEEIKVKN